MIKLLDFENNMCTAILRRVVYTFIENFDKTSDTEILYQILVCFYSTHSHFNDYLFIATSVNNWVRLMALFVLEICCLQNVKMTFAYTCH